MMALCEQCGSISIVRGRSTIADRVVAILTAKRPFVCRRCGWRGRRNWTDKDLRKLLDYGAGGAEPDPELAVLDGEPPATGRRKRQGGNRRKNEAIAKPLAEVDFDIDALSFANDDLIPVEHGSDEHPPKDASRPSGRHRSARKRKRQRAIVAAIAATALIMLVVLVLSLVR